VPQVGHRTFCAVRSMPRMGEGRSVLGCSLPRIKFSIPIRVSEHLSTLQTRSQILLAVFLRMRWTCIPKHTRTLLTIGTSGRQRHGFLSFSLLDREPT
jgi:hypothetical protein